MYWSLELNFLASPFFSKTQLAFVSTCLSEIRVPKQLPTASILAFLETIFSKMDPAEWCHVRVIKFIFLSLYSITWDFSHSLKNSKGGFDLISGNMTKNKIQIISWVCLWTTYNWYHISKVYCPHHLILTPSWPNIKTMSKCFVQCWESLFVTSYMLYKSLQINFHT